MLGVNICIRFRNATTPNTYGNNIAVIINNIIYFITITPICYNIYTLLNILHFLVKNQPLPKGKLTNFHSCSKTNHLPDRRRGYIVSELRSGRWLGCLFLAHVATFRKSEVRSVECCFTAIEWISRSPTPLLQKLTF